MTASKSWSEEEEEIIDIILLSENRTQDAEESLYASCPTHQSDYFWYPEGQ